MQSWKHIGTERSGPCNFFSVREDIEKEIAPKVPEQFEGWDKIEVGDDWKGRDRYLWMRRDVLLPAASGKKRIVGVFDFGKTGAGNNCGFEAMCYYNGKPWQGVDANHKEVFFREEDAGKTVSLTFRLWSGLEGGGVPAVQEHRIRRADVAWLDEETDDLYYLGGLILETVETLEEGNPIRYDLSNALDEAFLLLDWSQPGSESFYGSVHRADALLNERIDAMEKHSLVTVRCVGHTHIDLAWLWRTKHTREKASRSFSTVLRMMELFPEYRFLQTQPQLYAWIRQDFPEIYEKIKERIREGRWEIDGGMWVEADCNLTSGESLTRQLLLGRRLMKEEFGKEPEYLWLPDVFGYSWALPQILKKSGIETFMTTKISWNQYNRMPHDTFHWKGMDGSEVLTHFITTPEPWNEPGSWFYTYNGLLTAGTVSGIWKEYKDKEMNRELLLAYGYGDGGGGVNRDHLERRRRIDRIPGLPNLKPSTAGSYFRDLQKTVAQTSQYVHTWDGELYLEYHRGTYTSQAYNKRMNRRMELLYRRAELLGVLHALSSGDPGDTGHETLRQGWQKILLNQFHDIIPGSSIHEVYEDCRREYPEIEAIGQRVEEAFEEGCLRNEEGSFTVFNASNWVLDEIVLLPGVWGARVLDEEGDPLETQSAKEGTFVRVCRVPATGMKKIRCVPDASAEKRETAPVFSCREKGPDEGWIIETPFYLAECNACGQITRLTDKEYSRELVPEGERANVLQFFEDKPVDNDAWDIDLFYQEKMREVTDLTGWKVSACGPLFLTVSLEWKYQSSSIRQDMVFYSQDRRIDFRTFVDFHERQQLLKAAFPADVRTTYATYDIQYGNVRRPNHWNTSWDQARFESVAHRFADLSEEGYGAALLNDCKYGYDIRDHVMRISLLRSGLQPDHLQDQGEHRFTYSLLPHSGGFVSGGVVQEAYALNNPMKVTEGRTPGTLTAFAEFLGEGIELDAVKRSEDGKKIVLRFHEYAGGRTDVKIIPCFPWKSWTESDLMERPCGAFREDEISLEVRPYEIKTLLLCVKESCKEEDD